MKKVLDEDLQITLTQLDMEFEATERLLEDRMECCYHLTQELDQELALLSTQQEKDKQQANDRVRPVWNVNFSLNYWKAKIQDNHADFTCVFGPLRHII